jgi:hypothetical protein
MTTKQCEHCGKPVIIPDPPVLPSNLNDVCRDFPALCQNIQAQLNTIAEKVTKIPPLPGNLNDMCRQWPELCAVVKTQREQLNILARNIAEIPRRSEHPSPSESIVQGWRDCPDCAPKLETLLKDHPELFKPKERVKKYAWVR